MMWPIHADLIREQYPPPLKKQVVNITDITLSYLPVISPSDIWQKWGNPLNRGHVK